MFVSLTIVRYPKHFIPFALLSMAIFRLPLLLTQRLSFWKLMGCGKNGSFDIHPDWAQWGLLAVWETAEDFEKFRQNSFMQKWWKVFTREQWTILCTPGESHGKWDGKEPFKTDNLHKNYHGPIAVLTRASIRFNKLRSFWSDVPQVAKNVSKANGFISSIGIGEMPFMRQATFSLWESLDDVKQFAYRQQDHVKVIKKTKSENWYTEELFARFIPIQTYGTIGGIQPLNLKNATA